MRMSKMSMGAAPEPAGEYDDRRRAPMLMMRRGVKVDARNTMEEQSAMLRGQ